jgi:hypothetical protein
LVPGLLHDQLAAFARREVERHEEWDGPHAFQILCREDGRIVPRVFGCILTDVTPRQYPGVMKGLVDEWIRDHPGEPPYAFALSYEGYSATEPPPGAPQAEHDAYWAAARMPCGFRDLPGTREEFATWVVDVHGRGWRAGHYRDDPAVISETQHAPGTLPGTAMIRGLELVAHATGMSEYSLPGPRRMWN